ncbi:MAG: hypothetical protein GXO34_03535, partial [Deltaproteobacteria bacterium]|nr:hypothetical protein [Deltaproteobacteria bacterium]
MRLILRKIFNDRNYVLFLLISSSAMIFVVPIGSHVYRYLGPAMLLFFLAAKYFQGEMTASRLRNFKPDRSIFLFAALLGLSCVSFVPQTFGTMLIFATLYLGVKKKVVVDHHLILVVQF